MHVFLGYTLQEWVAVTVLLTFVFTGCAGLIRYFRKSISEPMKLSIDELREDLRESREQREHNEGKLFDITDDHTKSIIKLEGRVNNVEVATQSNTMRIDRMVENKGI
ncbi:hypothetical protein [Lactococcus lactis]|uniref:Uncharacterized protein n=1 Tax=Lactococcus lactis TaxID=1358 RepID=A0AAP3Z106_9LACT|nr:hypothetical protein [Lactococcus lactis]MDG4968239.1 hypothetical protein [Lactococcus lactis]MDG4976401.1 hypothetical protein [Lactococcus lactis]MDG5102205.1 hypothetical protein [Lactococcus lactis]